MTGDTNRKSLNQGIWCGGITTNMQREQRKKNLKKGPRWYGPYVVKSIMQTGNYYLQHRTKLMENAHAYAPHHLKAYIPRNPRIPQYSDDEYET